MYQMKSFDICYLHNTALHWKNAKVCQHNLLAEKMKKKRPTFSFPFLSRWSVFFVSLYEAIYLLHVKPIPSCLLCSEGFCFDLWTYSACSLPSRSQKTYLSLTYSWPWWKSPLIATYNHRIPRKSSIFVYVCVWACACSLENLFNLQFCFLLLSHCKEHAEQTTFVSEGIIRMIRVWLKDDIWRTLKPTTAYLQKHVLHVLTVSFSNRFLFSSWNFN